MMTEDASQSERMDDEIRGDAEAQREIRFLKKHRRRGGAGVYVVSALLLILGVVYAFWYWQALAPAPATSASPSLLKDRLWIDELPQSESDHFNFYMFASDNDIGINDKAQSIYKHLLEIFLYNASATDLKFEFPHDRRHAKSAYKIEKIARPKDDLDMKLTIAADPQMNGKTVAYYSSTSWNGLQVLTLPPLLRGLPLQVPK